MTGIHPPSPDDEHTNDPCDEIDDDRLNEALEAMLRGDRRGLHELDPEMGSTIDQLFGWAELSGFADEPASDITDSSQNRVESQVFSAPGSPSRESSISSPTPASRSFDEHVTNSGNANDRLAIQGMRAVPEKPVTGLGRRPILAIIQAIAAILLIAFAALGARSLVVDWHDDADPTSVSLAAIDAIPTPTVSPSPTPYPTNAPNQSLTMVMAPLSASDCDREPRSREELLGILGTPPAAHPEMKIGSTSADAETRAEIEGLLRSWWSCHTYGMTWEQTAYESKQYIRETIYGDPQISTAYSARTLNELLNGQSRKDAERLSLLPPNTNSLPTIAPNGTVWITREGDTGLQAVLAEVTLISAVTGDTLGETHEVYFVYEEGSWKIRAVDPGQAPLLSENFDVNSFV